MAGLNASDTETEQRWWGETCIMLPTSKVLIIFTFIKFTTWAFKVSKTLVIKDQWGQGVGSRFPNAAVHPTGLLLPLIPFSSIQWSSLLGHQSRGRIWSLPLSTPHLLAPPERIFLQLLLLYAFHPALHTQPGPWGSGLLWSQSSKDTPPPQSPEKSPQNPTELGPPTSFPLPVLLRRHKTSCKEWLTRPLPPPRASEHSAHPCGSFSLLFIFSLDSFFSVRNSRCQHPPVPWSPNIAFQYFIYILHYPLSLPTRWPGTGLVHTALGIPGSCAALLQRKPSGSTNGYLVVVVFPSIFWLFQIFTVPSFEHVAKSKCSSETLIRFTADLCSWRCATSSPLGRHPERKRKCILKHGWETRSPITL